MAPRLLATTTLRAVPAGSALDGVRFELSLDELVFSGVRATVDAGSTVEECDETDNTDTWADVDCWPA